MTPVRLYTTTACGFCHRAKQLLRAKGVAFEEIDVTGDDAMREKLVEMSGGLKTVPQIWIGDRHVGGYTDLAALDASGELARLHAAPA
jgi:glutaredoxin 3